MEETMDWSIFLRSSLAISICMDRTTSTCRHPRSVKGNCALSGRRNHSSDTYLTVVHRTLSSAFLGLSVVNFVGGPNRPIWQRVSCPPHDGRRHVILCPAMLQLQEEHGLPETLAKHRRRSRHGSSSRLLLPARLPRQNHH